jgi:hypothetical protein
MAEPDIHDTGAQAVLALFVLLFWGLLALVLCTGTLGGVAGGASGDEELLVLVAVLAVEGVVLFLLGLPAAIGVLGLRMRTTWGYWVAVLSFVLMLGGICLPFGAYGLWALLIREGARERYTGG